MVGICNVVEGAIDSVGDSDMLIGLSTFTQGGKLNGSSVTKLFT
jgi:hypothetical protein